MPTLITTIIVNNVDKSYILRPSIISIAIEDRFDQEVKPSQLSITFASNLEFLFKYGDKINIWLQWDNNATIYKSESFYIDYIQDAVTSQNGTFEISATEHITTYSVQVNNTTDDYALKPWSSLISGFMGELGLTDTVFPSLSPNGGTIVFGSKGSADSPYSFKGGSPIDFINKLNKLLGCVAKISVGKFRMYKITELSSIANLTTINATDLCLSLNFNPKITTFSEKYVGWYVTSESGTSWNLAFYQFDDPNIPNNNKTFYINSEDSNVYRNLISITPIVQGMAGNAYLENFLMSLSFKGQPTFRSGVKFTLGANFDRYAGSYFVTRCIHRITSQRWITDVESLPLNYQISNNFTSGFLVYPTVIDTGTGSPIDPGDGSNGGVITPPTNPPTANLVIGKFSDMTANPYDKVGKRYNDLTLDRIVQWILANTIFSNYSLTYNETTLREVLTPFYNDCNTNNVRYDIGIAMLVEITRGFTRTRDEGTKNAFFLGSATSGGTLQVFSQWSHSGNAAAQRFVRVSTTRGYVGTPRDTQIVNYTQNGSPTLYGLDTFYSTVVTDTYIVDTLRRMYNETGLATNATVQP